MSLPWEHRPAVDPRTGQPAPVPPPPAPVPTPSPRHYAPEPDVRPRPQRNDIALMIQNAVQEAVAANMGHLQANAQRALANTVQGKKVTITHADAPTGDPDHIEDSWQGGPATTKTFVQGLVIDVGFAMMAAFATIMTPGFNVMDKEAWTVVGALAVKTVLQTGISYMTKLKVN